MGLDAVVFCDCVEKKRLKIPHPYPRSLYIRGNGSPDLRSKDPAKLEKHNEWMELPPCKHDSMMVDGCCLGNIRLVDHVCSVLLAVLRPPLPRCPVLLGKVLYDGGHTGDHLTRSQVQNLAIEIEKIRRLDLKNAGVSSEDSKLIVSVITRLNKLIKTSQKLKKPIAF